jgi:hypothetical protein
MQVFISWSGPQSNAVALALREWLPLVLPDKVVPFVSSEDIMKGSRGLNVIKKQLEDSGFGIVVVTPSNLESTWIHFEAGALGRAVDDQDKVAPLLVGLGENDLDGPLLQYQHSLATDRDAVFKLVTSINASLAQPLNSTAVSQLFDLNWTAFESALEAALALDDTKPKRRDTAEMIDEVLSTVRSLQREVNELRAQVGGPVLGHRRSVDSNEAVKRALDIVVRAGDHGAGSISSSWVAETVTVSLPSTMPVIKPKLLVELQKLAHEADLNVRVKRANGSWVMYDSAGTETRSPVLPPQDTWVPEPMDQD